MAEIESLEIKLKADMKDAEKAIDGLSRKLSRLSSAMAGIDASQLNNLSRTMNGLSAAVSSLDSAKIKSLSTSIRSLSNIKADNIGNTAVSMKQFSKSLKPLTNLSFGESAQQIKELSQGINRLGYKSADKAIDNMPKLASSLNRMMGTLASAPKVSRNLIDMTNALASLSRTGAANIKTSASIVKSFNGISTSVNRAGLGIRKMTFNFAKLATTFYGIRLVARQMREAINIASDLEEVQNVVDVTFGDMADKVDLLAKTSASAFGLSELTLKEIASRYQAMGSAMGISESAIKQANQNLKSQKIAYEDLGDSMADVSLNLTKLAADMASFYNKDQKEVAEALESVYTGTTRPLRTYGLDLTEATLKEWAMNNGIQANIESMTQAEKTMLRYQYVMANTSAAQGDFARTSDSFANSIRVLKESFKALGSTVGQVLINALRPFVKALNVMMVQINQFAQTISDALGKIFGWEYKSSGGGIATDIEDGAEAAEDLESGLGGAADKAKKLKQQLQGLDELNVLSSDKDSGSGSGSGNAGGAVGGASNGWVQTQDTMLKSFESEIDNLYDLGKKISTTLTDVMDSINWFAVYQKAANFGKGLAEFLNGLINPDLFSSLGHTIAGAINTALIALDSFANEFDWKNFGNSLASGLNTFFIGFQFSQLTKTIADWFNGIVDAALEFVTTFKWDNLGLNMANGINTFFETFEFGELAQTISGAIKGVLETVTTFFQATDFEKIGEKIGEFLRDLDWVGVLSSLSSAISWGIESAFKGLVGLIKEAPLETAMIGAFAAFKFTDIGSTIGNKVVKAVGEKLAESTAWEAIKTTFTSASAGATTFATGLSAALVAAIGGFSIGKNIAEAVAYTIGDYDSADAYANFKWSEFFGGLNKEDAKGAFKEFMKDISEGASSLVVTLSAKKDQAFDTALTLWNGITATVKDLVANYIAQQIQPFKDAITFWNSINTKAKELVANFTEKGKQAVADLVNNWNKLKKSNSKTLTIKGVVSGAYKTLVSIIDKFFTVIGKKQTKTLELNAKSEKSNVFSDLLTSWKSIKDGTKTLSAEAKASGQINSISTLADKWNSFEDGTKKIVATFVDNFTSPLKKAWNAIATTINNGTSKLNKALGTSIGQLPLLASGGIYKNGRWQPVQQYAAGGFPSTGEMFVARENGIPELVGTIGGSTAVMNNNQIVDSVSDGVYRAVVSAMQRGGSNVNVYLQGDANKLFKVVQQKGREYARHTGNPVFV